MSDYVYCLQSADRPGLIRVASSREDPRNLPRKSRERLRIGVHRLELAWSVRVVDGAAAEAAVKSALVGYAHDTENGFFHCDPMTARAEAVRVTTLRSTCSKTAPGNGLGWVARLVPSRGRAA